MVFEHDDERIAVENEPDATLSAVQRRSASEGNRDVEDCYCSRSKTAEEQLEKRNLCRFGRNTRTIRHTDYDGLGVWTCDRYAARSVVETIPMTPSVSSTTGM